MKKTTIAIVRDSRKRLEELKRHLETERGHFVDMDECVLWLLDQYKS